MPLANWDTDANVWLDQAEVKFATASDASPEAQKADALVESYLSDVYDSALVAGWDEAGSGTTATPALVRYVAGRLMAAYRYSKKFANLDRPRDDYAVWLEEGAMAILEKISAGALVLPEISTTTTVAFSDADFYPNDATEMLYPEEARKFEIGMAL